MRSLACSLLVALGLTGFVNSRALAQSAVDDFDPHPDSTAQVSIVQPDGRILIGGDFFTISPNGGPMVTRHRIARLNPDGTLDATFDPNANEEVKAIVLQSDGKILVVGSFTNIGGQPRNRVARLDPVTGLADSFDPNANDFVGAIALQSDGKILVSGFFTAIGGQPRNRIARLDPVTGLADSFNPNANNFVDAIALQPNGKILVGGFFTTMGGQEQNYIARLDPNTGLADLFNPNPSGGNTHVSAIVVQPNGQILVGGLFDHIGLQPRNNVARLDPVTALADSFDPNASFLIKSLALQADAKVLVTGFFGTIGGQSRNFMARLDPTTGMADSFDPSPNQPVNSLTVQPNGKILAAGSFTEFRPNGGATVLRNYIARLLEGLPRIISVRRSSNDIDVIFDAYVGYTYRLERKLALTDADWQRIHEVPDLTVAATGPAQFTDPNALSLGRAFYRVRLLP
ncbi:MAG: hypothetical protein QOG48_1461, partial [Verrucomicrobiota bacterium]